MNRNGRQKGERPNSLINGTDSGDTWTGTDANERYAGHRGNDTMNGGGGDDWLSGGEGYDTFTGGPGKDVFSVSISNSTGDLILDFTQGEDKIEIAARHLKRGDLDGNTFTLGDYELTVLGVAELQKSDFIT
jgi:Ca2+-binding RTX toxin-like protein